MYASKRRTILAASLLFVAAFSVACDEDEPTGPSTPEGTYQATTFVAHAPQGDVDFLAAGSSLSITLHDDGTTTGSLFIPEGDEGADLNADMTGTWSQNGDRIVFDQDADTFVPDAAWTYANGTITTEDEFFTIVLTRR